MRNDGLIDFPLLEVDNEVPGPLIPVVHAAGKSTDLLKSLVSKGADIESQNYFGWRPLHQAAAAGNLESVKFLLDLGADPDVKDRNGITPLQIASRWTYEESFGQIVDLLNEALKDRTYTPRAELSRRISEIPTPT